eukprot:6944072-Alexandrium_andersonii.AAC.1
MRQSDVRHELLALQVQCEADGDRRNFERKQDGGEARCRTHSGTWTGTMQQIIRSTVAALPTSGDWGG